MTTRSKSKSSKSASTKKSQKNSKVADFGRKTVRDEIVLSVKDLKTQFTTKYGTVKAVDGVIESIYSVNFLHEILIGTLIFYLVVNLEFI